MRITQVQVEEIKDQKYSRVGGMDEKYKILKIKWKGQKIRDTPGKMGRMNDYEYSHLGGSGEHWKYSRLVGMDGRLEILQFRWQGCKNGYFPGQVEWMEGQKY